MSPHHIISTIGEKCKICYTCIRECPAKAIKVEKGQAEVIQNRCIHCGNCVKVCVPKAKNIYNSKTEVLGLLNNNKSETAVIIAPSFPAEFFDEDYHQVVGALRKLGFKYVYEVGFGADLVAYHYKEILQRNPQNCFISSTCPAIVSFVEKYHENLIPNLIPMISPMVAMASVVKQIHHNTRDKDIQIVFVGPCAAKKFEIKRSSKDNKEQCGSDVNAVLTFIELRELFTENNIEIKKSTISDFDPPHPHFGGLLSISSGLLRAANIQEDIADSSIITADGKSNFLEILKEFSKGDFKPHFLDILCCEGCIMGAGVNKEIPLYKKRDLVAQYVKNAQKKFHLTTWENAIAKFKELDFKTTFINDNQIIKRPSSNHIKEVLYKLGKKEKDDELDCGACGYETCEDHAIAIIKGLAESEMCLPYTIDRLKDTVSDLEQSYSELKSVKETLNHREKLASMGQLSAGIAHELNNPLGVVLMYAHLLMEKSDLDIEMKKDLEMIVSQSDRCKRIVAGLLNFSRQSKVIRSTVDLKKLTKSAIDSLSVASNIKIVINDHLTNPFADLDKDQISQVLINILNNAIDALEHKEQGLIEISLNEPRSLASSMVEIVIKDNGAGIPEKIKGHIFDPFFTTKQIGKGTGLGLPVSYGIIKMHRGTLDIHSNADDLTKPLGTTVSVTLPRREEVYTHAV